MLIASLIEIILDLLDFLDFFFEGLASRQSDWFNAKELHEEELKDVANIK